MTDRPTQEQLTAETDAIIIQIRRNQRSGYLKLGAIMILISILIFSIFYTVAVIQATVMNIMGQ